MYQTIKVADWVIEADVEETRKQYEKDIDDMCGCGNCFNFHAAVRIAQVLKGLGLVPSNR
ncbi:hypothetical protein [Bacillus atrophaeus]|uniref:hypothetical protein n=1 Tax=Bacillus atrophaeus TaxID=1452 RepID=UPI0007790EA0|nr:hypothetical protein [Bacillus atrophaeus]KYD04003.1 hypothetical protein B4144_4287 [Bacillus atrophaeus]